MAQDTKRMTANVKGLFYVILLTNVDTFDQMTQDTCQPLFKG